MRNVLRSSEMNAYDVELNPLYAGCVKQQLYEKSTTLMMCRITNYMRSVLHSNMRNERICCGG